MAMIEVRNLVKRYGESGAVNEVSFEVDRGEILGFLGPNGAGKTTTMKILTCFVSSDGGTVRIAGHDVFEDSLEARRAIGYLPENTPLYLEMGIVEFLRYICELRGVPADKRVARIDEIIEVCGLAPQIGKAIGELSKGYRQRVGLAQAMIHDPEILILDEPTSGLDPNQIVEIREMIRRIGREKTIILSTHILPEVQTTCDRAIIINEGRLVAEGAPEEIGRRAAGARLFTTLRAPEDVARAALADLEGVADVQAVRPPAEGLVRFEMRLEAEADPSEAVFHLAVARDWPLSELNRETMALEDVFRNLTVGDVA